MLNPVNPYIVLDELCLQATTRTIAALKILHQVLEQQSQAKPLDFSIATIGRLSHQQGGPSIQTIRNRTGKHFKELIEAWAAYSGTTCKKPLSVRQKQLLNSNDQHILGSVDDPVIRAVMGTLIAERNKYRDQLNVLKANTDIFIDRTQDQQKDAPLPMALLTPMELESLRAAVSADFMERMHWTVMPTGQVKDEDGREVYRRGYANGLQKLIDIGN